MNYRKNSKLTSIPVLLWLAAALVSSPGLTSDAGAQEEATSDKPGVVDRNGDKPNPDDDQAQPEQQSTNSDDSGETVIKPKDVNLSETYNLPPNFDPEFKPSETPQKQKITLDFRDAKLIEIVKLFSATLHRNYIISDAVKGGKDITIISPKAVTLEEAYQAFLMSLEMNGLTIVKRGEFHKIIRSQEALSEPMKMYDEDDDIPQEARMVTAIIPINNTDVEEMQSTVQKFLTSEAELMTYGSSLIITENASNLRRVRKLIRRLDRGKAADKIYVYKVQYADPSELQSKLTEIFKQDEDKKQRRRARRNKKGGGGKSQKGAVHVQLKKVIADKRTNYLIIKTNRRSFSKIKDMLELLDSPTKVGGQVHVKFLEYAKAEDLSSTLSSLAQGGDDKGGGGGGRAARRGGESAANGSGASIAALKGGDIQISAYKPNNALIITASPNDYVSIEKVIDLLDRPRKQVYVEAVIMEISMGKDLQYGLGFNALAGKDFGGIVPQSAQDSGLIDSTEGAIVGQSNFDFQALGSAFTGGSVAGSVGLLGPGATLPGTEISLPAFALALQATQTDRSVNLLSTPSLMTLDNEEAEIEVQDQEPVPTATGSGGLGGLGGLLGGGLTGGGRTGTNRNRTGRNTSTGGLGGIGGLGALGGLGGALGNPIDYKDVGITLSIKPQVNESNYIRLEIDQEVSDIKGGSTFSEDIPTTTQRSAKTVVLVKDQSTVVIGGLMKERKTKTITKIPFIGDIPVFGQLFRNTGTKTTKQNLVLMLTPYIIESQADIKKIYERKMKERKELAKMLSIQEKEYTKQVDFQKKSGLVERMRKKISSAQKTLKARRQAQKSFENQGPKYRILGAEKGSKHKVDGSMNSDQKGNESESNASSNDQQSGSNDPSQKPQKIKLKRKKSDSGSSSGNQSTGSDANSGDSQNQKAEQNSDSSDESDDQQTEASESNGDDESADDSESTDNASDEETGN